MRWESAVGLQKMTSINELIGSQANWIQLFEAVDRQRKISGTQIVTINFNSKNQDDMVVVLFAVGNWTAMALPIIDDLLEVGDGILIEVRDNDVLLKREIIKRSICQVPMAGAKKLVIIEDPVPRIQVGQKTVKLTLCVCKKVELTKCCSNCKVTHYCSCQHQQQDWPQHRLVCDKLKALVQIKV